MPYRLLPDNTVECDTVDEVLRLREAQLQSAKTIEQSKQKTPELTGITHLPATTGSSAVGQWAKARWRAREAPQGRPDRRTCRRVWRRIKVYPAGD